MIKWPFVSRKKLEAVQQENETERHIGNGLSNRIHFLEEELNTANEVVDEIIPRFTHIDMRSDPEYGRYRVCVDFDRRMVEQAFTHGADDRTIRYFAARLAHEIEYKMIHFNFARCGW